MRIRYKLLAFALANAAVAPVHATSSSFDEAYQAGSFYSTDTTGQVFADLCGRNWTAGYIDPCGLYLIGVIDALAITHKICPAFGVRNRQLQEMAYRSVMDQPDKWHTPAISIIEPELAAAFPCPQ